MNFEVLVAGELYLDLILSGFDFWPLPGQEAFARDFRREIGGGAAITACGLAMLGVKTGVCGHVGSDYDEWIWSRFRARGVETDCLTVKLAEPTGLTVAITTPHDRAFLTYSGANRGFMESFCEQAASGKIHARHVHIAAAPDWDFACDLFDHLHASGATVSLDAGWHEPWLADPRTLAALRKVDIFFPNETEAKRMTGASDPRAMLERFAAAGLRCVALKLGSAGSALLCGGDVRFATAPAVEPIDTTGAGDCFAAGFLRAWLRGEKPERWLSTGNVCGALSCEAFGGLGGFPTPERLAAELERHPCER
jgi:sugar/nucleoside kinase (ribokinase family)